jgi:hypothetical protein
MGTQTFSYDHRDRLTNWTATGVSESYAYDLIGNITSKAGVGYNYDYNHTSGAGGPYAVRKGDYLYDNNDNMTRQNVWGQIRTYAWNTENQPTQISFQVTTETYTYDTDCARVKKTRGFINTHYRGGLSEKDKPTGIGNTTRSMYLLTSMWASLRRRSCSG